MREPLPLARIQEAVLEFLRNRDDAALFGAQAVNAYVDEPRMTQDVDVLSTRAADLAEELRGHLAAEFNIAVRVRVLAADKAYRVFQLRQPKNRHLVDVRQVDHLPPTRLVADIRVPTPEALIGQKVIGYVRRRGQPKADTDLRDIKLLLLAHPHLKQLDSPVADQLRADGADAAVLAGWQELVDLPLQGQNEDEGF